MRYLSVCSGIEAASAAWKPLGWKALAFAEIEPFCCAVLEHHHPDVPNLGDITKLTEQDLERFIGTTDVLVGGTPCQSFSVAGLRKGMADPRGNLALRFCQLTGYLRPRWLVWENVPGVHSSWTDAATFAPSEESCRAIREAGLDPGDFEEVDQTSDFNCFLSALVELGYGIAARVLDAQFIRVESHPFAVPQRRERVFVVGCLGDWRGAAAVLLERESLCGYPPPRREAGKGVASSVTGSAGRRCGQPGKWGEVKDNLVAYSGNNTSGPIAAAAVNAKGGSGRMDFETETLVAFDTTQLTSAANRSHPKPGDPCHPLAEGAHPPAVAFQTRIGRNDRGQPEEVCPALQGADAGATSDMRPCVLCQNGSDIQVGDTPGALGAGQAKQTSGDVLIQPDMQVRRLTPVECARLMGFPDNYLAQVTYRKRCPPADGPMYRALGNSIAVNCMRWIGERIQEVDELT